MKKGRHRRFEEARALKQMSDDFDALFLPEDGEPCDECGAAPGSEHKSWCLAASYDEGEAEADRGA